VKSYQDLGRVGGGYDRLRCKRCGQTSLRCGRLDGVGEARLYIEFQGNAATVNEKEIVIRNHKHGCNGGYSKPKSKQLRPLRGPSNAGVGECSILETAVPNTQVCNW
jgi:hypothetical protein